MPKRNPSTSQHGDDTHLDHTFLPASQTTNDTTQLSADNDDGDTHSASDRTMLSAQRDKRRPLFSRFSKKKNRNNFASTRTRTTTGQPSGLTFSGPHIYHSRKWSHDSEDHITSPVRAALGDNALFYGQPLPFHCQPSTNEGKRSAGLRGRGRDKLDKTLSMPATLQNDSSNKSLNESYESGNGGGTINSGSSQPWQSNSENSMSTMLANKTTEQAETWVPPESWGYQPPDYQNANADDNISDSLHGSHDDYAEMDEQKYAVTKKNYCIRVFRQDGTFATLQVPLYIRTGELVQKLASKFFMHDTNYSKRILERVLQPHERPVKIQKILLEQMGYTEQDNIESVGRDDNSYLLRFIIGTFSIPLKPDSLNQTDSQHMNLKECNLPTVPIFLYKCAPAIISLDLSKNSLIEIPVDFTQMCINLKQLWLTNNEYIVIPQSIRHIAHLEYLNIAGNSLYNIEPSRLEDLSELKTLQAYNNRLAELPEAFSSFRHLTEISIANNAFTVFPVVLCSIASLTSIDISFNKIAIFPDEIGDLTQLNSLFAVANKLTGAFPPAFANLENLKVLDIRQNCITELNVLSRLPKLETLRVEYNAVRIVHGNFERLRHLKLLKNHLTQFNINSAELKNDPHMDTGIPYPIACNLKGSMLTDLNLSGCKLTLLPDNLFLSLTCLEVLVLDNNALNSLPSGINALQKLTQLSVQDNGLISLPCDLPTMTELKVLDVQKNNLSELPQSIWLCSSLQVLNCSSNLLETFPEPYPEHEVHMHLQSIPQSDTSKPSSIVTNSAEQPPPNFNPPSFFDDPKNRPPPLSLSLRHLYLGDNRLSDDVWSPLSMLLELRTLNLSFNDLYEIPPEGLRHEHLVELYLSGNHLTSFPADDIVMLTHLCVLAVNGNKLQTLPAEIGKLRKLQVLDVSNNVLKYNIANWPYDWNWNWNLCLTYLNLSGNKRFEVKKLLHDPSASVAREKNLSDFSMLTSLRMLGLMDVTILGVSVPEESPGKRVRTSPSEVSGMSYGIADWLGANDYLPIWDLVMPRVCNNDKDCLFGLFDGKKSTRACCKVTKYLNDHLTRILCKELMQIKEDDTVVGALRRTFLTLEKGLGGFVCDEKDCGASAVVCFISDTKLYVANVGDVTAVLSRNSGQAFEVTQKHIPLNPSEISRIRGAGGFVSNAGLLNGELSVSRSFGYLDLVPVVNANPFVSTIELNENDEFIIVASSQLWETMSYQTAVDVARTEKGDMMAAAQKLRDFALTYGANKSLMVMVIGVGDLFTKRDKRLWAARGQGHGTDLTNALPVSTSGSSPTHLKSKRRGKETGPGDSILARLDREVPPPINQVALVFTDIKSSTYLWDTHPESMRAAIKIHDAIMRRTLRGVGGYEVKTEGDAFMVCFQNITSALLWCFTVQLQLLEADWPKGILETEDNREIEVDDQLIYRGLSVRMGIHWGTPVFERNPITNRMDYFGPVVNKASRICNAADGGQICVSSDVLNALRNVSGAFDSDNEPKQQVSTLSDNGALISRELQQLKRLGFCVMELGLRRLKGLETPETLSLVYPKRLEKRMERVSENVGHSPPKLDHTTSPHIEPTISQFPSRAPSPVEEIHDMSEPLEPPRPYIAPLLLEPPSSGSLQRDEHVIDTSQACALSRLAVRLERLTAIHLLSRNNPKARDTHLLFPTKPGATPLPNDPSFLTFQNTSVIHMLDNHMTFTASDKELMDIVENFVARIENAVSSLYLQKVGHFANALEKLGEAIELDAVHVLRALQMYADVMALTEPSGSEAPNPPQ